MDVLTDENDVWLNAVRSEDYHDYFSAAFLYLEDMSRSVRAGHFGRAAMSCSCVAADLVNLGDSRAAITLYEEAAKIYEGNADLAVGYSIRESVWSLSHAYEYYYLISDSFAAERVARTYLSISKKIDHFRGEEKASKILRDTRDKVDEDRASQEPPQNYTGDIAPAAMAELRKAIAKALELAHSRTPKLHLSPKDSRDRDASFDYERDIIS
jgi:hypothetical protein